MAVFPYAHRKVFIGAGPVRTSGNIWDLKAGELGLFDGESYKALSVGATYTSNPSVILAQGSFRQVDVLALGHGGGKESIKSRPIEGHFVSGFRLATPKRARNHQVGVGFVNDGDDTKTLVVEKDATYKLRVTVKGSPVSRFIQHDLYHDFIVTTDCIDKCTDPCSVPQDPKAVAESFVKQINEHPFISPFVKAEARFKCTPDLDENESNVEHTLYCLEVCDTGDALALAEVQGQFPDLSVSRVERRNSISKYQVCIPTDDGAPDDFTTANTRVIPNCAVCPTGYTLEDKLYKVEIKREDAGDAGALTAINSNYTDEVGAATTRVSYEFGTSTYIVYFETQADAQAAVDTPVGTDLVLLAGTVESVCVLDTATPIEWAACGERYKTTRFLSVVIAKDCGGSDRLTELEEFYANESTIVEGTLALRSTGECADVYEVEQYNRECLLDPCSAKDTPTFDALQSFEGFVWKEDEAAELPDGTECLAGIILQSAYVETKFGNCSFDPYDHYDLEIPRIDVSQIHDEGGATSFGVDRCATVWPVTELQTIQFASGTGEMVKRELIDFMASRQEYFFTPEGSRMNETQDVNSWASVIDRNKFYKIYYLTHNVPYRSSRTNLYDNQQFENMIVFEETLDTTAFENVINGYVSSVGVQLKAL